MSKITIRKRRKKNSFHGWLLWFALTASFALMGFSLAAFSDTLYVTGTMNTAECFAEITGSSLSAYSLADRGEKDSAKKDNQDNPNDFFNYQVSTNLVVEDRSSGNDGNKSKPALNASNDESSISISIEDAYPGDVYRLRYWIENKGTIPIELDVGSASDHSHLKIDNSLFSGEYIEPGDSVSEELLIKVSDHAEGHKNYNFSIELNYSQWKGN